MKPKNKNLSKTDDLFRSRLDNILNLHHALATLANLIDWGFLESIKLLLFIPIKGVLEFQQD